MKDASADSDALRDSGALIVCNEHPVLSTKHQVPGTGSGELLSNANCPKNSNKLAL